MIDKDLMRNITRPAPLSGIIVGSDVFYDNSSLDTYRVCPRKFYFRHVRHFETSAPRMPLIFGSSWHSAMDFVWLHAAELNSSDLIEGGDTAFRATWETFDLDPSIMFDIYPRTPERAVQILQEYVKRYQSTIAGYEILGIEKPFIVPISDDLYYVGKLDKIIRVRGGVRIVDHKTASSFSSQWMEQFSPSGQVDGYLHAGHHSYQDFEEVVIDGAMVSKSKIEFCTVPVRRQLTQLNAWSWEVLDLIDMIQVNEERLHEYRNSSNRIDFLPAFPKCTSSCTTYYGCCPYIDLCKFWANPEEEECPVGFIEHKWTPFDIQITGGEYKVVITGGD